MTELVTVIACWDATLCLWGAVPDVSKDLGAFTFGVEQAKHLFLDSTLIEGSMMPHNFRNTRPIP